MDAGLAALAGALLGFLSTMLLEERRLRHERQQRWDHDRRRVYSHFLAHAVTYSDAIAAWRPDRNDDRYREMERIHQELMAPLFELRLLARAPLAQTAENLKAALDSYRYDEAAIGAEEWNERWYTARAAVIREAKRELGIEDPQSADMSVHFPGRAQAT